MYPKILGVINNLASGVQKYTNLPFKAVNDLEANSSLVIKTPTT